MTRLVVRLLLLMVVVTSHAAMFGWQQAAQAMSTGEGEDRIINRYADDRVPLSAGLLSLVASTTTLSEPDVLTRMNAWSAGQRYLKTGEYERATDGDLVEIVIALPRFDETAGPESLPIEFAAVFLVMEAASMGALAVDGDRLEALQTALVDRMQKIATGTLGQNGNTQ